MCNSGFASRQGNSDPVFFLAICSPGSTTVSGQGWGLCGGRQTVNTNTHRHTHKNGLSPGPHPSVTTDMVTMVTSIQWDGRGWVTSPRQHFTRTREVREWSNWTDSDQKTHQFSVFGEATKSDFIASDQIYFFWSWLKIKMRYKVSIEGKVRVKGHVKFIIHLLGWNILVDSARK